MFTRTAALAAILAFSAVCQADDTAINAALTANPSEPGEGYLVRQMLLIDATLGLKTEQQKFQERLDATKAKTPVAPQYGGTAVMSAPTDVSLRKDTVVPAQGEQASAQPANPVLRGVFGIGRSLTADVEYDHRRLRFQSGRTTALGMDSTFPVTLVGINPPCVTLRVVQADEHLCLTPITLVGVAK
jgi:hypothetical protein